MTDQMPPSPEGPLLPGLDGSNPLGFLAALGTLRTLAEAWRDRRVCLGWRRHSGAWRPVLCCAPTTTSEEVVATLQSDAITVDKMFSGTLLVAAERAGPTNKKGKAKWRDKLRFTPAVYADFCRDCVRHASVHDRSLVDCASAWATEAVLEVVDNVSAVRRTNFDFTAGNQALVAMMREVVESTTEAQIREALFGPWVYHTGVASLRWDPVDEARQYALQAVDPQNGNRNPIRTVPGANRLAICALSLFPVVPASNRAEQPGFRIARGRRTWAWPIWQGLASLDVVRGLLFSPAVHASEPDRRALKELGVAEVFFSDIVQPAGRYRNFTPARAV